MMDNNAASGSTSMYEQQAQGKGNNKHTLPEGLAFSTLCIHAGKNSLFCCFVLFCFVFFFSSHYCWKFHCIASCISTST